MNDNEEPNQDARFQIEGPDVVGCVWVCSAASRGCLVSQPRIGPSVEPFIVTSSGGELERYSPAIPKAAPLHGKR